MEEIIEELKCPFLCPNVTIKNPVVLKQCGHIFCLECIESWIKSRKRTCPICRKRITDRVHTVGESPTTPNNFASNNVLKVSPQLSNICNLLSKAIEEYNKMKEELQELKLSHQLQDSLSLRGKNIINDNLFYL